MIETILHDYNGIVRSVPIIWTSRETLKRRMKELGIPVPPKGGNRRKIITDKFLSMQTEEMTASEIAKVIGCRKPTIYKLAVKHNKPILKKGRGKK